MQVSAFLMQVSGSMDSHHDRSAPHHIPTPIAQPYTQAYGQQHNSLVLFSSIMLGIQDQEAVRKEQEVAQTLTSMDSLTDIISHMTPSASDSFQTADELMTSGSALSKLGEEEDHWSDEEWVARHYAHERSDGSMRASDEDRAHGSTLLQGLSKACSKDNKKSKKKRPLQGACEVKKVAKCPCQNASQAALSKDSIRALYMELISFAPATESMFKTILEDSAIQFGVSQACLRNILTCRSRAEDSSKFWPDGIWELYRSEVRCPECRKLDPDVKVLCTHNNRGCPFKVSSPPLLGAASGAASNSPDASSLAPKMDPLTDKDGKQKNLKRSYKVHLELGQIWEAFGCIKTRPKQTDVAKGV